MNKKIAIIGAENIGKTVATELMAQGHTCVLHDVMDSQFTDLRESEPFMITRLCEFKEPWIDPKRSVINYKKHEQTCAKNRKKRKKKRHR